MSRLPYRIGEVIEQLPGISSAALDYVPAWRGGHLLQGTLRPFEHLGVEGTARLLCEERPLQLTSVGGLISPVPAKGGKLPVDVRGIRPVTFDFEMFLRPDGSHPRFYFTSPRISRRRFQDHPHLHFHPHPIHGEGLTAGCIYAPHLQRWDSVSGPLIVPVTWAASWAAAHAIWAETKTWLTANTPHDAAAIWKQFGLTSEQCQCGSGRPMRLCCVPGTLFQGQYKPGLWSHAPSYL